MALTTVSMCLVSVTPSSSVPCSITFLSTLEAKDFSFRSLVFSKQCRLLIFTNDVTVSRYSLQPKNWTVILLLDKLCKMAENIITHTSGE